jgi:hypothetical protein|tara:strand:+ start:155 stop:376 length:222 start_codon:yes stop_codon:yes gene_type:complete
MSDQINVSIPDYELEDIILLAEEGMDGDGREAGELFHLIETTLVRYHKPLVAYAEGLRDEKPWERKPKIEIVK